jgi:hypothetical protein
MNKPSLYTASTLRHGPMWRGLRAQWPEINFTASWIDTYLDWQGGDIADICQAAWAAIETEIINSDYLAVFADAKDSLRGGLVEAGIGIGHFKTIFVVGAHSSYGTWQYHYAVRRVSLLEDVRRILLDAQNPDR